MPDYELVSVDLDLLVGVSNGALVLYDSGEVEEQKLLVSGEKYKVETYVFYRDPEGQAVRPIIVNKS